MERPLRVTGAAFFYYPSRISMRDARYKSSEPTTTYLHLVMVDASNIHGNRQVLRVTSMEIVDDGKRWRSHQISITEQYPLPIRRLARALARSVTASFTGECTSATLMQPPVKQVALSGSGNAGYLQTASSSMVGDSWHKIRHGSVATSKARHYGHRESLHPEQGLQWRLDRLNPRYRLSLSGKWLWRAQAAEQNGSLKAVAFHCFAHPPTERHNRMALRCTQIRVDDGRHCSLPVETVEANTSIIYRFRPSAKRSFFKA